MPEIICDGNCQHQKDGTCQLDILAIPFKYGSKCPKRHRQDKIKIPGIPPW
ncbi:MAG: hypothetical protein H0Z35_09645 [Thermoanaerobacteraceae bacterium]|nr:hypothetical protein [Thermoanaerobacteraceae bacterium]